MKPKPNAFTGWHALTAFQQLNVLNDLLLTIDVSPGQSAEYMIAAAKSLDRVVRLEEALRAKKNVKNGHD